MVLKRLNLFHLIFFGLILDQETKIVQKWKKNAVCINLFNAKGEGGGPKELRPCLVGKRACPRVVRRTCTELKDIPQSSSLTSSGSGLRNKFGRLFMFFYPPTMFVF